MSTWSRSRRKGKRKLTARAEGSGNAAGIILDLEVVENGLYGVAYTVPILVGPNRQNFSLQVDTGSSDLWVASTSCSSSTCGQTKGRLYNPDQSTDTGSLFNINYLQGNVAGPIVWDTVELGGYGIATQALSAASTVVSEPLSPSFNGILGLAPPLNSKIAQEIPPTKSDNPDGAPFSSNLFGITPISSAPAARFFSLVLSRPDAPSNSPSLLGIGRHPSSIVSDPSKIHYASLVSERSGTFFWKTNVRAITVYVDGSAKPINLGRSVSGGVFPTAVLDSGVPLILTTSAVANGIYGALGIGPASDGQYYVPCTTPLNLTITLDDRPEISLHPLDLTGLSDPSAAFCVGLIQSADAQLSNPNSGIGDMILGVPFMRNTYTVMGYDSPNAAGVFPPPVDENSSAASSRSTTTKPTLGLLGLTDPMKALDEFHTVRVLRQPLSPGPAKSNSPIQTSGKSISVGIAVLIGLLSFFALSFSLFALRFVLAKRSAARSEANGEKGGGAYRLTRRGSVSSVDDGLPSEDTLRTLRYQEYLKERQYSGSSEHTQIGDVDELGVRTTATATANKAQVDDDAWDPHTALYLGEDTLVSRGALKTNERSVLPTAGHALASGEDAAPPSRARTTSVSFPLLGHTREDSRKGEDDDDELAEFGVRGVSMAGVGTAARGSVIDPGMRTSVGSLGGVGVGGGGGLPVNPRPKPRPPPGPRAGSSGSVGRTGLEGS